jgi:hypothetical protein
MFVRRLSQSCAVFLFPSILLMVTAAAQEVATSPSVGVPGGTPPKPAVEKTGQQSQPSQQIVVPAGTRLPLALRNGINTRTAKAGDSVYFETIYPIAQNNRIVLPMGSFLRGELLQSKRPGFVKGRGEIRMALYQITLPNGYTLPLEATPSSADRDGNEGVDKEGTIKGRADGRRDVGTVVVTTAGGAYIGTLAGAVANGAAGTGALIGGGVGAAAGILAILATRGPEAELPRGTTLDVIFDRPLILDANLLPANVPGKMSPDAPGGGDSPREKVHGRRRPNRSPLGLLIPALRF